MRVPLFGVGTRSQSWAITAQRRINCYVDIRKEQEKTSFALVGRPGLKSFVTNLGSTPSRGLWSVNSLSAPLAFVVQGNTLYSVNNAGITSAIGSLSTNTGFVSMVDDGTYLVLVDGQFGYYYNMITMGGLIQITDGNFTTTPTSVTWQDTYFIVTSAAVTKQFQLSANSNPASWPAVNINFVGSAGGKLQAGISDHSILNLFGDVYTDFYQDTGAPDFPFASIPGAAQQFGLAAGTSLAKFDNSLVGLFQDQSGNRNISRMSGFNLKRLSDVDIDYQLQNYSSVGDAYGFSVTMNGHPFYVLHLHSSESCHVYDGLTNTWAEWQDSSGGHFFGSMFCKLVNRLVVANHNSGDLLELDTNTYTENDDVLPMEVVSKHIWDDDRYIGISWLQVDVESGVGTATGQGANPVMDLQVSDDGGNSFYSVGYSSVGPVGEYTQRVTWNSLGAARDRVLKLRITDPVKRVITGASAELVKGPF